MGIPSISQNKKYFLDPYDLKSKTHSTPSLYFQPSPNPMPIEGDWKSKFICAVRNSITNTCDVDKLAHGALTTNERAWSPSDVPKGRLRKYLKSILVEPRVYLGVSPPTQADILGAEYTFERPCFHSVFLATVLLHHAHTFNWNGLLHTLPDARALTYPTLTLKDVACVAVQLNHMCAGKVGGGV